MAPAALRIQGLSKVFKVGFIPKKVVALDNVTLEVEQGEIFGLLGPNGAGKTTTIKCILNLVYPDSGTIELLGDPMASPRAKARIGFLSESPYVYDFLTGREYLIFSGKLHGYDSDTCRRKANELLEIFHLQDAAGRQLRKYSKGMLQRIGLAQALINDPDFLILDEPMSGLDPLGRKEVRELICDRVAVLVNGKMQMIGRLQDHMKQIAAYEVTLVQAAGVALDGIPHEVIARSDSRFLVRVPSIQEVDAILTLSRSQRFVIESIVPQRQTLEELYLKQIQ